MICLDAYIKRLGERIKLLIGERERIVINLFRTHLLGSIERISDTPTIAIARVNAPLSVRCGIVCSIRTGLYLNIEPEHIFLMKGNNFTDNVIIYSNVIWKIN